MIHRWRPRDPFWPEYARVRLADLLLAAGVLALAATAAQRLLTRPEPLRAQAAAAETYEPPRGSSPTLLPFVASNPFAASRLPPAVAFAARLDAPPEPVPQEPTAPALPVRVAGTGVVPGGRSFAVLQREGHPARLVREGEAWGDLVLVRVSPRRATVRTDSGSVELTLDSQP